MKIRRGWKRIGMMAVLMCSVLGLSEAWADSQNSQSKSHKKPEPSAETIRIVKPGVVVETKGISRAYGEAFAAILSESRKAYKELYGFDLPETLTFRIARDPKGQCRLFTDGESCLYLTVTTQQQLAPWPQSGVANLYGTCHELGHIVMYSGMRNLVGLPEGVGEGWAHYTGSEVLDRVAARLGKNIWPDPYDNVVECEGTGRLKKLDNQDFGKLDPTSCAAKVFYEVDKKYGPEIVGRSMRQALSTKPSGKEIMPLFVEAVRKNTGDKTACDWVPQSLLTAKVQWKVKQKKVDDNFFADMKANADKTGMVLCYDNGKSGGKISSAGGGHAVLFQAPESKGDWLLDRVDIYGGRYGGKEAPKIDFTIYICDEDFNPIREFNRPYRLFPDYKECWHRIPIDPVKVPRRFYVCVNFNPTNSRGVFIHYDKSVKTSHSRWALPYTYNMDVDETYDWMIRPHLRKE
jgi:hypothetical protein